MALTVVRNLNDRRVIAPDLSAVLLDEEMEHLPFRAVIGGGCLTHEERVMRPLQGKIGQMCAYFPERSSPLQVEGDVLPVPVRLQATGRGLGGVSLPPAHAGPPSRLPP